MFIVYIIQNCETGRHYHYIGSTKDFARRLAEHNNGQNKSTRYGKSNWKLIYHEEINSEINAKKREREIKSFKGGNSFKKLFDHSPGRE